MLRSFLFLLFLVSLSFYSKGQDTLLLLSGKTIVAKNIEVGGYAVSYHGLKEGSKLKRMSADNIFSIKHADGTEQILYERDTIEEDDFTVDQMRMYIRGEQDAMKYYKNNVNKAVAFGLGGGFSVLTFYGIIGPAIYATIVGSTSPNMERQPVPDHALLQADEYRQGYERKARENKIKNSILYGFAGFVTGFATFRLIENK